MKDPGAAIRAYLLTSAPLVALAAVFADELPEGYDPTSATAVVICGYSGDSHSEIRAQTQPRIQVRVWSGKGQGALAKAAYIEVWNMMHGVNNVPIAGYGRILSSLEGIGPQDIQDPSGYANVLAYFDVKMLDTDMTS